MCYNLFGYLPAPVVYGLIATWTNPNKDNPDPKAKNTSKWAMAALLYSTIPTISLLLWGLKKTLEKSELAQG